MNMMKCGVLLGLVGMGLTTVVVYLGLVDMGLTTVVGYPYVDVIPVAADLAEKLHLFIHQTMVVTTQASHGLRQSVTGVTLVSLEHVTRGLEQAPNEVTVAIRYLGSIAWMDHLRSIAWMDHIHMTNAALQQAYTMGTGAVAGIKHAVSELDGTIRVSAPSDIAPYLTFAIILVVIWLVRLLLLAIIEILRLLEHIIVVGLHGAGVLALLHILFRAFMWLLVCTLQTIKLSANGLNDVLQFLAQSLAVSPSPTAIKPTKCKV